MKLKSDTIPGSGTSLAGIIDRDIAYDKYGLPYIPAKRLKGVLRESAEDLRIKDIDKIFGVSDEEKGCELRIDNGLLTNQVEYVELLQSKDIKEFLPKETVLDFFTYTRSQTMIENGVAKDNSLRVSRVLKKDLTFAFNLECNPENIEDLKNICKVTRDFGASRTRGFGEVELELINELGEFNEERGKVSSELNENSNKIGKMRVFIENEAQLLISSRPGYEQISEDFITGSTLHGAIASNYIKKNGVNDKFHELFLSGKISFGNLYPAIKDKDELYYPSAMSIKKVKTVKAGDDGAEYYDHSSEDFNDTLEKNIIFKGGFAEFANEKIPIDIIKNTEAHHQRPSDRAIAKSTKEEGKFFQFETIEQGQCFAGEIIGSENLLCELRKYFPNSGFLRLGKSKTGQYGKCRYKLQEIKTINKNDEEWRSGEDIKFILRSDMILINENGFATPDINLFIAELANKLAVKPDKLLLKKQFSKTTNTGGFMGVWKLPRIQKPAFCGGTIVVLKNASNKDLPLSNIETMFFGDRTKDGYGRIAVYTNSELGFSKHGKKEIERDSYSWNNMPKSIKELTKYRVINIVKQELQAKAINDASPIKMNSFIGKIVAFLKSTDSFEQFNKKLKAIDSEKQKENLKKMAKGLILNKNEVDERIFKNIQLKNKLPSDNLKIKYDFELYKHYALAYLTQVKYLNRGNK